MGVYLSFARHGRSQALHFPLSWEALYCSGDMVRLLWAWLQSRTNQGSPHLVPDPGSSAQLPNELWLQVVTGSWEFGSGNTIIISRNTSLPRMEGDWAQVPGAQMGSQALSPHSGVRVT